MNQELKYCIWPITDYFKLIFQENWKLKIKKRFELNTNNTD